MHLFGMLKKLRKRMDRARQPLKLTGTGQILILIAFAIGAAAMNTGNNLLYLAWALVLSAIIFSGLISEVTLGIVKASVSHIMDARVGESFQIPVVLNNRSRFLASFGILPIVSFFVGQEHRHVVGEYVLRLKASGRRESYAEFLPRYRGQGSLASLTLSTQYPFGFFTKSWRYRTRKQSFYILPQRLDVSHWLYRLTKAMGEMPMAQRGVGDEFFSLKNYEQGDDPRMLSWRRLAKTGRLYVKENESTQGGVIWLVLEDPHLQPLSGKHEPTEKAIAMTASLTEALVRQGHRVGLCGPGIYLQPSNTQGHLADALKQLAVLKDPKIKMIPPPARQLTVRITSVAEPTTKIPARLELT